MQCFPNLDTPELNLITNIQIFCFFIRTVWHYCYKWHCFLLDIAVIISCHWCHGIFRFSLNNDIIVDQMTHFSVNDYLRHLSMKYFFTISGYEKEFRRAGDHVVIVHCSERHEAFHGGTIQCLWWFTWGIRNKELILGIMRW